MPVYHNVSKEKLKEWGIQLKKIVLSLIHSPSKFTNELFVLQLYEYLLLTLTFRTNYDTSKIYKKLTVKIPNLTHTDELSKYVDPLLSLKSVADSIRHDYPEKSHTLHILGIIQDEGMYPLWNYLRSDIPEVYDFIINEWQNAYIEIYSSYTLKEQCLSYANKLLHVDSTTNISQHSVGETIQLVSQKFNCSETFALNIVLSIIKDDYRVL